MSFADQNAEKMNDPPLLSQRIRNNAESVKEAIVSI